MYTSSESTKKAFSEEKGPSTSSTNVSFLGVVKSTISMNFNIWKRYKVNLFSGLIELTVLMLVFSVFAFALEFRNGFEYLTQTQIMIFFMGAITIMMFNSTAIWTPVETVQRDLYNGTLEYIYFNPASRYGYFVGTILADGIIKFVSMFLPAFAILIYFSGILSSPDSIVAILLVVLVILINLISLGVLISLAAILWKQVSALAGILNTLFQFLSGAFFPINAYPEFVQYIAYFLPHTFGYDLIRYYSFQGDWKTILPIEFEIVILLFFTVFYLVLSIVLLKKTEKFAKRKGLHLI